MEAKLSELVDWKVPVAPPAGMTRIVESVNPAMKAIERLIADIASTDIPILLVGESGTGKEIVALEIHRRSRWGAGEFVKVNCASVSPESLFDLVKGSRNGNGAKGRHRPGTLFFDEICEFDVACQSKVLHALPDGDGAPSERVPGLLEGRLICATRRNPEEEMRKGRLREEFYFRVNGVCLRLPPLRHRKEDIPLLVSHFARKYAGVFHRPEPKVSAETLDVLTQHAWLGNIRELENVVKKMVALGDERMAVADLAASVSPSAPTNGNGEKISLKEASRAASRQAERELILRTLLRTRWNRKRAAQELQISYKALLYKLKQIGVDDYSAS